MQGRAHSSSGARRLQQQQDRSFTGTNLPMKVRSKGLTVPKTTPGHFCEQRKNLAAAHCKLWDTFKCRTRALVTGTTQAVSLKGQHAKFSANIWKLVNLWWIHQNSLSQKRKHILMICPNCRLSFHPSLLSGAWWGSVQICAPHLAQTKQICALLPHWASDRSFQQHRANSSPLQSCSPPVLHTDPQTQDSSGNELTKDGKIY